MAAGTCIRDERVLRALLLFSKIKNDCYSSSIRSGCTSCYAVSFPSPGFPALRHLSRDIMTCAGKPSVQLYPLEHACVSSTRRLCHAQPAQSLPRHRVVAACSSKKAVGQKNVNVHVGCGLHHHSFERLRTCVFSTTTTAVQTSSMFVSIPQQQRGLNELVCRAHAARVTHATA